VVLVCWSSLVWIPWSSCLSSFFFAEPSTAGISTLSLHDALPILGILSWFGGPGGWIGDAVKSAFTGPLIQGVVDYQKNKLAAGKDRKSTRLNSSHRTISYAVFCLKKKKTKKNTAFVLGEPAHDLS